MYSVRGMRAGEDGAARSSAPPGMPTRWGPSSLPGAHPIKNAALGSGSRWQRVSRRCRPLAPWPPPPQPEGSQLPLLTLRFPPHEESLCCEMTICALLLLGYVRWVGGGVSVFVDWGPCLALLLKSMEVDGMRRTPDQYFTAARKVRPESPGVAEGAGHVDSDRICGAMAAPSAALGNFLATVAAASQWLVRSRAAPRPV